LAKTVKGYGMGDAGESENTTHQVKKLNLEELKQFRDRFDIPLADAQLEDVPYFRPPEDSAEITYMNKQRHALGGAIPQRVLDKTTLKVPGLEIFAAQLKGSGKRSISTTMAFVRILGSLIRDKSLGKRVVPIVPDEARTFGMEGMFRQLGIYSSVGQLYEPEDSDALAAYKESENGQVIEAGINEAGAFAAWMAAATSYSTHQFTLLPFYIYYSMFGFQRIGDLAWAAGDSQAKGFLLGGTAGRTTLNGEGLQHQDGHSHLLAATIPNCISYDPAFAYELAVIVHRGLEHMYAENAAVYYYITLMNEAYQQPEMPQGVEDGIVKGMYLFSEQGDAKAPAVRLFGSGTILLEAIAAATMLVEEFGLGVQVWSLTSATELARDIQDVERWNLLNPTSEAKQPYVAQCMNEKASKRWAGAPVVAVSDYMKALPEQLRSAIDAPFHVLGTDGYGRSDTREKLRHFFEVDRSFIVLAALGQLARAGKIEPKVVEEAQAAMGLDADKTNPRLV
jgi:pyruvate dehydrogenase E1 component